MPVGFLVRPLSVFLPPVQTPGRGRGAGEEAAQRRGRAPETHGRQEARPRHPAVQGGEHSLHAKGVRVARGAAGDNEGGRPTPNTIVSLAPRASPLSFDLFFSAALCSATEYRTVETTYLAQP